MIISKEKTPRGTTVWRVSMMGCLVLLLIIGLLSFHGCQDTGYNDAECIGVDDAENPKYSYGISTRNVVMGILFFPTIVVPVVVVLDNVKCPEGPK